MVRIPIEIFRKIHVVGVQIKYIFKVHMLLLVYNLLNLIQEENRHINILCYFCVSYNIWNAGQLNTNFYNYIHIHQYMNKF